ncbi:MAG: YhcB family protein, partial [Hymenobacteraceae bacterium]|nr:YhcB family protein [Hymenobacteraceae bacterium]
MLIFWTFVIGAVLGYVFGYYIKPNHRLRKAIGTAKEALKAALEEGNKGVYRTVVTDHNQTSELTVEVKELAVTQAGQVKVAYLSAYYKNPEFRTRKGEALLREVRDLLGDYLPLSDIEWYDNSERHAHIKNHLSSL